MWHSYLTRPSVYVKSCSTDSPCLQGYPEANFSVSLGLTQECKSPITPPFVFPCNLHVIVFLRLHTGTQVQTLVQHLIQWNLDTKRLKYFRFRLEPPTRLPCCSVAHSSLNGLICLTFLVNVSARATKQDSQFHFMVKLDKTAHIRKKRNAMSY